MTQYKTYEFFILVGLAIGAGVLFRAFGTNLWPGVSASICGSGLWVLGVKVVDGIRPTLFIMAVVIAVVNLAALVPV